MALIETIQQSVQQISKHGRWFTNGTLVPEVACLHSAIFPLFPVSRTSQLQDHAGTGVGTGRFPGA